jgi:hypothetical protein
MSDTIRRRLSALLAKTVENGCTEAEQDAAMQLAAGIAAKHGIDLEKLYASGEAVRPKVTMKRQSRSLKIYEAFCAEAAGTLYGVECNAHNFGKHGFFYVGREDLIEVAEDTMLWLVNQIETLYKAALAEKTEAYRRQLGRAMDQRARKEFRDTFKDACAQRVYERARGMIFEMKMNEQEAQRSTGHNALTVRGHFATLRTEINEYWDNKYKPSPEALARIEAAQERERQDRLANPEKWAILDKQRADEAEKLRRKEERRAARRKGTQRSRQPKFGSGTHEGRAAADQVKLRKELK